MTIGALDTTIQHGHVCDRFDQHYRSCSGCREHLVGIHEAAVRVGGILGTCAELRKIESSVEDEAGRVALRAAVYELSLYAVQVLQFEIIQETPSRRRLEPVEAQS